MTSLVTSLPPRHLPPSCERVTHARIAQVLASGESAAEFHNRFPEAWAQVGRTATAIAGGAATNEIVFFVRSAWTQSPGIAPLFWQGDQLTSWDAKDGLRTALLGTLSGGLSGRSLSHSDVGGYFMVDESVKIAGHALGVYYVRNEELLQRWTEMSALSDALMRTHPGLLPAKAAQVWSSPGAAAAFARMVRVHVALAPYRRGLMAQAAATGAPLARPLFVEFPADAESLDVWEEFMLGPELLVAPVFDAGASSVDCYFPPLPHDAGRWVHVWTGAPANATGTSPAHVTVAAPLSEPAVFFKEHSATGAALAAAMRAAAL